MAAPPRACAPGDWPPLPIAGVVRDGRSARLGARQVYRALEMPKSGAAWLVVALRGWSRDGREKRRWCVCNAGIAKMRSAAPALTRSDINASGAGGGSAATARTFLRHGKPVDGSVTLAWGCGCD